MLELAREFMTLFQGLDRAYGTYSLKRSRTVARVGEKILGKPSTVQGAVDEHLWDDHLAGRIGIGIVPIMDNSTCGFGAIDIDVYKGLDVAGIIKTINDNDLPLVPCRTKSGGLHLYSFVEQPVPATLMREKLAAFAGLLGHGGVEIYPKQDEVLSERGDIGQWINMPYQGADKTTRYAYDEKGERLSAEDFIAFAKSRRLTVKEFKAFTVDAAGDVADGPPCLQYLVSRGFSEGSRNDGLFCVAIYLKKAFPTKWKNLLDEYNIKYFTPPLGSEEVTAIAKSIDKKDYCYPCDKNPIKQYCNITLCRTREHGIGLVTGQVQLTGLTKYDTQPPVWFVDVDGGGRLELTTADLQQQGRFQKRCMESLNTMPPAMKPGAWQAMIQGLLEGATIIEAPAEASPRGLLFLHIEKFCTSRAQAREKEEILLGKPWTDEAYHYFRIIDLMAYLERCRFDYFGVHQVASILKETGGESKFFNLKGKGVNAWRIAKFAAMTEPHATPEYGEDVF